MTTFLTLDGNEAAAYVAHLTNEVIAIYPITPSTAMGEWADEWSSLKVPNLWGTVPEVIEMQSEAGAAGAIHGALQAGALATTFTASQGLLLMIPNMYKIAGELSPLVMHVSARSLAAQALSIFGDHSDVMACRTTGFAMLCSASVQEVMDFALIAQAATLAGRVPFVHFFDGFRTSHEVNKIERLALETIRALIDDDLVRRPPGAGPEPGSSGPARHLPEPRRLLPGTRDRQPLLSGPAGHRRGGHGPLRRPHRPPLPALRVYRRPGRGAGDLLLMGSGLGAAEETVEHLVARGDKVGLVKVRLFRPFSPERLLAAIPTTAKTHLAVLDRTKEPGADGEPLYKDVLTALAQAVTQGKREQLPRVVGGRYGLSSKEFTPGMVLGIFEELARDRPRGRCIAPFTVGIIDDVGHTSLNWDSAFRPDALAGVTACVFYGLGSDGTVSANKNSIKIIARKRPTLARAISSTTPRRPGRSPSPTCASAPGPCGAVIWWAMGRPVSWPAIRPIFLKRYEMLDKAAPGGIFLLNTPTPPERSGTSCPGTCSNN
jgi:pyruvate-ferredoxin/flavodoxin oxidoreductase